MKTSADFPESRRLEQLLAERFNGTMTVEAEQELNELLEKSASARALLWEQSSIHSNLYWIHRGKSECDSRLEELEATVLAGELSELSHRERFLKSNWAIWLTLALAASLLILATSGLWIFSQHGLPFLAKSEVQAPEKAVRLGTLNPLSAQGRWSFGEPGDTNRREFRVGDTLWLNQGAAELKLTSGVVANLESPTILKMVSLDCARLLKGRMTVDVPKGEEGFTVETAAAEVIDLGTNFRVDVADTGDTDVVVFQGLVDVNLGPHGQDARQNTLNSRKRLHTGEALRVTEDGTLSRIVNVRRTDFSQPFPTEPLIREVRDNIVRQETMKYYEIVVEGMQEDALAYVDRMHQWNGIHESGIPKYLLGGDYVKTFNDDKVSDDLVITLKLERPAQIYVLVDDRLEDTSWLAEFFEDTGDDVGIDEGPTVRVPKRELSEGAGLSIDNTFSVWKCRQISRDSLTIGPYGPVGVKASREGNRAKLNMIGIIAIPVDKSTDQQ